MEREQDGLAEARELLEDIGEDVTIEDPVNEDSAAEEAPQQKEREIFEVGFKGERSAFFLNPQQIPIGVGDSVIVEADRGEDLGRVLENRKWCKRKQMGVPRPILRKATREEVRSLKGKEQLEKETYQFCKEKIAEHGLQMKLVDVERQFDGNKICFLFTADKRVDFRQLVKDLAAVYKTRIDLRQIGVRDEAGRFGGYGPCGRKLCCSSFIEEFEPVSAQMAKEQHLALSPAKISGVCGRLMCCLRYEQDFYRAAASSFPKIGAKLSIDGRACEICKTDIFHDQVRVRDGEGHEENLSVEDAKANLVSRKKSPPRNRRNSRPDPMSAEENPASTEKDAERAEENSDGAEIDPSSTGKDPGTMEKNARNRGRDSRNRGRDSRNSGKDSGNNGKDSRNTGRDYGGTEKEPPE
ncbi:MAG: regulatory iron-sulfur-containing complex subunit RicT [Candidatus Latescibacterota bacterium]